MDFSFTADQNKLRRDMHEFLLREIPRDHQVTTIGIGKDLQAFEIRLERKLGEKGWLTPGWPKEYGGLGLGHVEQGIILEEFGYWLHLMPDNVGIERVGPMLFLYGTEEQKKKFLPPISRGRIMFWQCFTEPNAGSDESNVQLRATEDGDSYVLNGQKMFNGHAYKPDYLLVLTRTADTKPKHRGLTLFILPANTPGITYKRLPVLGDKDSNELFFDDVRVPKTDMLGQLNRGFYLLMGIFEFERTGTHKVAPYKRIFEEYLDFCKRTNRDGKRLIDDPRVRDSLAQMVMGLEIWRLAAWYAIWRFSQRKSLGQQPYDLTGLYMKRVPTYHAKAMMDIMGLYGQLRPGSPHAELGGKVERLWERARSFHGMGTIEIYKTVLAHRGLGLPRRARPNA